MEKRQYAKSGKTNWKLGALILTFLLPALTLYCVYTISSLVVTAVYSLQDWSGVGNSMTFIGLDNYARMFRDPTMLICIKNNLLIVATAMLFQIPPAMILALLINTAVKGIKVFRAVYFFPQLMSTAAVGILWVLFYDPYFGLINNLLAVLGFGPVASGWLGDARIAIWCVIVVICWQNIPFHMILLNAGLKGIPQDVYESAHLDGASAWQTYWHITFPLMSTAIKTCCTLALIGSIRYFDLIYVMTQGGPNNATQLLATYMYRKGFLEFSMGYASTIAVALFVIIFIATFLLRKLLGLWKVEESA